MSTARLSGRRQPRAVVSAVVLLCIQLVAAQPVTKTGEALNIAPTGGDAPRSVATFERFEQDFTIDNTVATLLHWPYDAAPPPGIPGGLGISVDAVFVDPAGREYRQPAFYYQRFLDDVRDGRDWHYPTREFVWKVRFSPNRAGTWKYRIVARDRSASGATGWRTLTVTAPRSHGFVRVSRADSRYFEFEDGTFFTGLGFQLPEFFEDPVTRGGRVYAGLESTGINFVRFWISSIYGSAWAPFVGGRNRYSGYLPVAGLMPVRGGAEGETLAMRVDYERTGDSGWFDACRLEAGDDPPAVKPNTRYRVRATYMGQRISGPRNPRAPQYGLVVKLGGMFPNCYEPGTSRPVTSYGANTATWRTVEGEWFSGSRSFLPKVHVALENATGGQAYVRSVSVREILPSGADGPEVLARPSMEYHRYIPQARAYALDRVLELAERHGVYLKLVVLEKGDEVWSKFADDGQFVTSHDNADGVYGTGRVVNRTRWLQQAWWRYLQARWGYSPHIHSWELLNEGDPASVRHFELADEFGKYMHFGVFGVAPDSAFDHPNDHLVTTSFWHSFPAAPFWASRSYPHIDYADLHAYVSTSPAPRSEREKMMDDAAYYHLWHSQFVAAAKVGKPVVRGEAGLDVPGRQDETALGIHRDRTGVWLHNFLWSTLDSGGLYELYWWRSHIWNRQFDHRPTYRRLSQFLSALDLNKGGYRDWGGTVSTPRLRVVGQKNLATGRLHLWIHNVGHTWKRTLRGESVAPVSGELVVPGFSAGKYLIETWNTHEGSNVPASRTEVAVKKANHLVIAVNDLPDDLAIRVRPFNRGGGSLHQGSSWRAKGDVLCVR